MMSRLQAPPVRCSTHLLGIEIVICALQDEWSSAQGHRASIDYASLEQMRRDEEEVCTWPVHTMLTAACNWPQCWAMQYIWFET